MDRHVLIKRLLSISPYGIAASFKECIKENRSDGFEVCKDLSDFADLFVSRFSEFSRKEREAIFSLIEEALDSGTQDVQDGVATCFIESILNAIDLHDINPQELGGFGQNARAFIKAIDEFHGTSTGDSIPL